jgi:hypothetical protein
MPKLAAQVPYQVSIPAVTGTLVHQISEIIMKDRLDGDITLEDYWLGKVESVEDFEIEIDQEMIDCARTYTEYVQAKAKELDGKLLIEEQVSIDEITDSCWGTADAIILAKDKICVIDLKSGKWPVKPENNYQLMIYGLGALSRYGDTDTKIELTIVQPRGVKKEKAVKTWETTAENLVNWGYDFLKPRAEACFEESPGYVFGDHCKFCNGRSLCETYKLNMGEK